MDTTKTITHVSLCAGYGGIDLGLSRAIPNLRTVAFSEIEAFACANLVSKMEAGLLVAAPIWTNLKTFPWEDFRDRVDILSGGYPCQPFSAAGKRLGKEDPRHLWPWIADGIAAMRPRVCFFENVEGHISLGLREVIEDLERLGYKATWGIFSASEVGAPHQRKRVFILAYDKGNGLEEQCKCPIESEEGGFRFMHPIGIRPCVSTAWPSRPGQPQHEWEPPRVVGNTIVHDGFNVSRTECRQEEQSITSNSSCLGNTQHNGSHQCGEESRGQIASSEQGRMQESKGGSPSVGNAESRRNGQQQAEQQGWDTSGRSSEEGRDMGNPKAGWRRESGDETCEGQGHRSARSSRSDDQLSQAQPSLGGDSDGTTYRMDNAELFVTSDNRTDELRLLGNGVVPATATRAFLTLMDQLLKDKP